MNNELISLMSPNGATKYLFFGGKGGVGKTTLATATAVWFADHGHKTTIVSKRLGHSKPSITLDVYGHLIPSKQEEAAQLMDDLMFGDEANCTKTAPK